MKNHSFICTALVSLTLLSTICSAGENQQLSTVSQAVTAPSARSKLCQLLLNRLDADSVKPGESHPVKNLFSMLGLMLGNSSGMSWELKDYQGLSSIERSRELIGILKKYKGDSDRNSQIKEIYDLFSRASETGDDFKLASLLYSMEKLTDFIGKELFFANSGPEKFTQSFMSSDSFYDPDKALSDIAAAWNQLLPQYRAAFAEWLGRSFSEGSKSYIEITVKFLEGKQSVKVCQLIPDLRMTLSDYLAENPGNKREMTKRYYRFLASRLLQIYGINYSEDEGSSATPTLPGKVNSIVSRAKQLLLGCN